MSSPGGNCVVPLRLMPGALIVPMSITTGQPPTGSLPRRLDAAFLGFKNIPRAAGGQHAYLSTALGQVREVWVYTPPGYESLAAAACPLLFLQHKSGGNEQTWGAHGSDHRILDSLASSPSAKLLGVTIDLGIAHHTATIRLGTS